MKHTIIPPARNSLPIVQANASRQEPAATKAMNAPPKAPSA